MNNLFYFFVVLKLLEFVKISTVQFQIIMQHHQRSMINQFIILKAIGLSL